MRTQDRSGFPAGFFANGAKMFDMMRFVCYNI